MLLVRATDPLDFPYRDCTYCSYFPALKKLSTDEVRTAVVSMVNEEIPNVDHLLNLLVTTAKVSDVVEDKTMSTFLVCLMGPCQGVLLCWLGGLGYCNVQKPRGVLRGELNSPHPLPKAATCREPMGNSHFASGGITQKDFVSAVDTLLEGGGVGLDRWVPKN